MQSSYKNGNALHRAENEDFMKKIINGKVYDTETAQMLGDWDNGHYTNDFAYCAETLYRKKTGEYFLFGEGHALSKYASHSGNSSGWGEKIIPLSYNEAQEWAEEKLDGNDYVSIFGDPEEDDSLTPFNQTISAGAAAKFRKAAQARGISQRQLLEELIENNL